MVNFKSMIEKSCTDWPTCATSATLIALDSQSCNLCRKKCKKGNEEDCSNLEKQSINKIIKHSIHNASVM